MVGCGDYRDATGLAMTRGLGMESRVEALTQEIVEIYKEAYYTLRRS